MNFREKAFKQKFKSAAMHLGVDSDQIISLKLRENVSSYNDYDRMLDILNQDAGLNNQEIKGDFQGKAFLINNNNDKVIIVEHESGLEILHTAGSVASLICLIPIIIHCWSFVRDHLIGRSHCNHNLTDFEIRRIDKKGKLIEENYLNSKNTFYLSPNILNISSIYATNIIESKINAFQEEIQLLNSRISALEKNLPDKMKKDYKSKPKTLAKPPQKKEDKEKKS
jgi:hypothetical protein